MPEPYSISLLNDSFPPLIDGVANTVVNYARELTKLGDRAIVVTPEHPDADDSRFPFPVARYPSVDTRRLFGYLAGYPFSPETLRQLKEQKVDLLHSHCPVMSTILARSIRDVVDAPLVFTYHTKFDVDVAKLLRGRLLQESALYVLASNISACDEVWVVSHGAGENLRSIGYQGDYQVMENGVDMPRGRVSEEAITAATADYDLPEGVPVFLFVGRMMWYKGLRIILDALKLLQAGGQDFRMVIVTISNKQTLPIFRITLCTWKIFKCRRNFIANRICLTESSGRIGFSGQHIQHGSCRSLSAKVSVQQCLTAGMPRHLNCRSRT